MLVQIEERKYEIVRKSDDKAISVTNLNEKIAFKFIIGGKIGGIAVSYPLEKVLSIFSEYLEGNNEINIFISGGDSSQPSLEYEKGLLKIFSEIKSNAAAKINIVNHANKEFHLNALALSSSEL